MVPGSSLTASSRFQRAPVVWSTCRVNEVRVEFLREIDRPALCQMLEQSESFPRHQLLGYQRPRRLSSVNTLVAWRGDVIVGMLTGSFDSNLEESGAFDSFEPPPAPHAFLVRLHVHESARGNGVGRALVETYATEAQACGCTFIGGSIDRSSDPTYRRAFFERLGFAIRDLVPCV